MMRSMNRFGAAALLSALALGALGCAVERGDDEAVGEARRAQIDAGQYHYLVYAIWQDSSQIGQVLVARTQGGGYSADTEYWYMTSNVSMEKALTFTSDGGHNWDDPPSGLGTLSFTMRAEPDWGSDTPSGTLLEHSNETVMIDWRMEQSGSSWSGKIGWWNQGTGRVFGPDQTNTLSPSSSYSGSWNNYVAEPL